MPNVLRTSIQEAALIVVAAIILGFGYTGMMKKGLFMLAPKPTAETGKAPEVTAAFISFEEASTFYGSNAAVFLDARHEFDFKLGHIKGAMNLPLKEFDTKKDLLASIAKDKLIVTYCDGEECNSSIELAKKLVAIGYINVKIFFGGWNEWSQKHRATE